MTSVNFYCINESIADFTYDLLYQLVVKNGKKVLLYSNSIDKLNKFNDFLWSAGRSYDFLPHSIITDENISDKLILSNKMENIYNQEYLFLSNLIDNENFLRSFEKIFYIFRNIDIKEVEKAIDIYSKFDFKLTINVKKEKWVVVHNLKDISF